MFSQSIHHNEHPPFITGEIDEHESHDGYLHEFRHALPSPSTADAHEEADS